MDLRKLIKWSFQRWWWFVISVGVCCLIGGIYYLTTVPKFSVEAALMLRQAERGNQDEMLRMMGYGGSKITADEVKVLTSRDLMGRVVDTLHLCTIYSKRSKRYWVEQYPEHDLTVVLLKPQLEPKQVRVKVSVNNQQYKIRIHCGMHFQTITTTSLDQPVHSFMGDIFIDVCDTVKKGTFRAVVSPKMAVVEDMLKKITISRMSRESNVITFSTKSTCPKRAIATINTLLDLYNQTTALDKNQLAIQTEDFLASRIELVTNELNSAESELEMYKRVHQIANLEVSASNYQQTGENYERQEIQINNELHILDLVAELLPSYENAYALIPENMGLTDGALCGSITNYNSLVTRRQVLLQTATEQNVVVKLLTDQIDQAKQNIHLNMDQLRHTLLRRRQFVQDQQNQYVSRLASIPETERRYLEMKRDKQTKEKQYLYLIEKREENAMLLASEAVPAKIVDRAHQNPNRLSPKVTTTLAGALFFGVLIPFLLYFIGILRKELL